MNRYDVITDIVEEDELVAGNEKRKALVPDGFRAQVVKKVFSRKLKLVVGLYNACLSRGYFPREWKVDVLKLLLKYPFSKSGTFPSSLFFFQRVSSLYPYLQRFVYVSDEVVRFR